MEPRKAVKKWVSAFNDANVDALSDLYAEDAINHQVVQDPVVGKARNVQG